MNVGHTLRRCTGSVVSMSLSMGVLVSIAACSLSLPSIPLRPPSVPERPPVHRIELPYQGWSDEERHWFHHVSQGTSTPNVPYDWFMALEQPSFSPFEQPLLSDPEYLARFGFLPSPRTSQNPGGLPIGFAVQRGVTDPATGETFDAIGFTCAACHTGQIEYRGTAIRIEGGPAMTDLGKLRDAIALALGAARLPPRFGRFAARVLGPDHTPAQAKELKGKLTAALKQGLENPELRRDVVRESTEEGFGRLDALGRIGNFVFAVKLDPENIRPLRAPVAYPHIWGASWFDWVQYNGSIRQPMVRNAGEALGVYALADFIGPEATRFRSNVAVGHLYRIEQQLAGPAPFEGLRPPRWPEHVLGEIDREKAARGAALYTEMCQGCHLPPTGSPEIWNDAFWEPSNEAGERYLKLPMIPISLVGTDPNQARDMRDRKIDASRSGISLVEFGPALAEITERTINRWYDDQLPPVPEDVRRRMNGNRDNAVRAPLAYRARPLDGIWATPPYLHNGSVPNLYFLLSPVAERPRSFYLGSREFDPVRVGYEHDELDGGFRFVADDCNGGEAGRGNCNTGHELRDGPLGNGVIGRGLTREERFDLIEYLKTL